MAISLHDNQLLLVTVCSKIGLVPAVLLPQQQEWVQYLPSHHDPPVTSGSRIATTQILPGVDKSDIQQKCHWYV